MTESREMSAYHRRPLPGLIRYAAGYVAIVGMLWLPVSEAKAQAGCRAADSTTAALTSHVLLLATETGAWADSARAAFGIPAVAAADIHVATDSVTCMKVADARNGVLESEGTVPPPAHSVYVLLVGSKFLLFDPDESTGAGEFRSRVYLFDAAFKPAGGWSGP